MRASIFFLLNIRVNLRLSSSSCQDLIVTKYLLILGTRLGGRGNQTSKGWVRTLELYENQIILLAKLDDPILHIQNPAKTGLPYFQNRVTLFSHIPMRGDLGEKRC